MSKRELVDIEVEILAETDLAVLVFDGETTAWLPKSQIEIERPRIAGSAPTIVTLPERLATDKGLV